MNRVSRISVALACALGMSAAVAQTVQRGDATVSNTGNGTQTDAQASPTAPIQTAQASGSAGGTATGASAGGVAGGAGVGTTLVVVGAALAAIAVASDRSSTVSH